MKSIVLLSILVFSIHSMAGSFGTDGSDGQNGVNGTSGRSGQDITIRAGAAQDIDLSGSRGDDAISAGHDGSDAWGCFQDRPTNNLVGASGGDGGDGGSGGSGGSGGDVTVYYKNIEDLKKLRIVSLGAPGGRGLEGGRGGRPCYCSATDWYHETCSDVTKPDGTVVTECDKDYYYCSNGDYGRDGSRGSEGSHGSNGYLTIIKSETALLPDVTYAKECLNKITSRKIVLEKDIFARRSGAGMLLAAGSRLSDTYSEYTHRNIVTAKVEWRAPQAMESFGCSQVAFQYGDEGIGITLPSDYWFKTSKLVEGKNRVVAIDYVIDPASVKYMTFGVEGDHKNVQLRIKDNSPHKEYLANKVSLVIKRKTAFGNWKQVFSGNVDANLANAGSYEYLVALNKLNVEDAKSTFKKKKEIMVIATVTRSFEKYSLNVGSGDMVYKQP